VSFILSHLKAAPEVVDAPEGSLTSKLAAVLYLPHVYESIKYRPYLDTIGSRTFLEWFIHIFTSANREMSLSVLVHIEDASSRLKDILEAHNIVMVSTLHKTQTKAFQEVAIQTGKQHVAFFSIEIGLSPSDLLSKAFLHHLAHENKFTFIKGLPTECAPEIYDTEFLSILCERKCPHIPQTPRAFAEYSLTKIEIRPYSTLQKRTTRYFTAVLNKLINAPFASTPFTASNIYGEAVADLPEAIKIDNPYQFEIARSVIQSLTSEELPPASLQALHLWKRFHSQARTELRKFLFDSISISNYDTDTCRRRRILFVSNPSGYSGAEESLCQLIGRLDSALYESFALIGVSGYYTERLRMSGAQVITQERDFSATTVDNFLFTISTLINVRPDVIHINGISGMPIVLAAKLLGMPIVHHLRIGRIEGIADVLNESDAIIAVSNFVKTEACKKGVDKNKIQVIFDGVDLHHFSRDTYDRDSLRREYGIPINAKIALNIARFAPNKRHDLLIAASAHVIKSVPSFHLVLIGEVEDKQYHAAVVEQAAKLGLSKHISYIGFQRDIRRIEAVADVLVLCSDREPLGTCLMEAMAMGIPVITTDSGGSQELIQPGVTGLVAQGGSVKGVADAITKLLLDNEYSRNIAYKAKEYAKTELSIDLHAKRISAIYTNILSNTRRDGVCRRIIIQSP
jgi:glycosyltransferase involved in cell wall biosynthesis